MQFLEKNLRTINLAVTRYIAILLNVTDRWLCQKGNTNDIYYK